jgi:hypothetical protein
MSRPGKKVTRKTILMNSRIKEMELKERSSRSLLANVLDMDDDLLCIHLDFIVNKSFLNLILFISFT